MKITNLFTRSSSLSLIAAIALMASCQDEDKRLTASDSQDISEEAVTDSYYQDLDDMGSVAIATPSDAQLSTGRTEESVTITVDDQRFSCATVTLVRDAASTADVPKGTITVDFGMGCTDARGNIRSGKLIFAYYKRRFQPGSTVVETTDNYYVNGIKLEGTRTSTNVTGSTADAPKFNVVLTGGKATFPDNAVATRESNITWSWVKGATRLQDELIIDKSSTASGTTRGGRTYTVSLQADLVYKRTCFMAVEGVKKYLIDGTKEIVIDYSVGDCKNVNVTVNGVTHQVTVK
ncbi:MAG TPA: hypothetical protein VIM75_04525 [Ohtaekwangia sp.]|uniref:hypothetical protein n=1 Tax=Ohtaekwangia sp. TaxID=2066019 RepID=UPI002F92796E